MQWISVEERNPERAGNYFATFVHHGTVEVGTRWFGPSMFKADEMVWSEECGVYKDEVVIAWMPLPEPSVQNWQDNASTKSTNLADAIVQHAEAMEHIAKALEEFVTSSCSVDALGVTATHPTFIVKGEKDA